MCRKPRLSACPDFLADFSDFVDGDLSDRRRSEIVAHLDCCEACLRHLKAYRRGVEAWRGSRLDVIPGEVWEGVEPRIDPAVASSGSPRGTRHPAFAMAVATVFAVVVLWTGVWTSQFWPAGEAERTVSTARGERAATPPGARIGPATGSEPVALTDESTAPRTGSAVRSRSGGTGAAPRSSSGESRSVVRRVDSERIRTASLGRASIEELERRFEALQTRMAIGAVPSAPSFTGDGWIEPVELRPARFRTAASDGPSSGPWTVEAALVVP